ncbi:hypothetical protein GJ496_000736 [Pomphorhynchus laevis]|nr:hypothetical protein GJ496_000736 [Pomphorhynchus laevis]
MPETNLEHHLQIFKPVNYLLNVYQRRPGRYIFARPESILISSHWNDKEIASESLKSIPISGNNEFESLTETIPLELFDDDNDFKSNREHNRRFIEEGDFHRSEFHSGEERDLINVTTRDENSEDGFSSLLISDEELSNVAIYNLSKQRSENLDDSVFISEQVSELGQSREKCPQCNNLYDRKKKRRISEACGHMICLTCSSTNDDCPLCLNANLSIPKDDNFCEIINEENFTSKQKMNISDMSNGTNNSVNFAGCKPDARLNASQSNFKVGLKHLAPKIIPEIDLTIHESCSHGVGLKGTVRKSVHEIDLTHQLSNSPKKISLWINDDVHDSGPEYCKTYTHSHKMFEVFRQIFGLKEFRPNQREAINAALLNEDCFIIMPTGGGKSLCYQLPAYLQWAENKTKRAITIVISPLKALIYDQVQKLQCLGIPAMQLSSTSGSPRKEWQCSSFDRNDSTTIVYLTPEKLGAGESGYRMLDDLYASERLNRFVIDEAHCVSEWGHDFRPDYKSLGRLRKRYPKVPLMLLTATATNQVRIDVLKQMNLLPSKCKLFIQSFNRPNLKYVVLKKEKGQTFERNIIDMIKTEFPQQSGILYCLSRNDTEKMSSLLSRNGIPSLAYHAGQSDKTRINTQQAWTNDQCKVICATIAFGMGIDKPDVRFVFHISIPKSIEGYYQESGRAGRDGKPATCVMLYSYYDMIKLKNLITKPSNTAGEYRSPATISRAIDHIHRVVQYCENKVDCRRRQLLAYFGERYHQSKCSVDNGGDQSCDVCSQSNHPSIVDVTDVASQMIKCICQLTKQGSLDNTLAQYVDIFKGSMNARAMQYGQNKLDAHACAAKYTRCTIERLLLKLVLAGYLKQDIQLSNYDTAIAYICPGPKADQFYTANVPKILLPIEKADKQTDPHELKNRTLSLNDDQLTIRRIKLRCLKDLKDCLEKIEQETGSCRQAFSETCLREMAEQLPGDKQQMLNVTEVTERKFAKYNGCRLLTITSKYKEQVDEIIKAQDNRKCEANKRTADKSLSRHDILYSSFPSKRKRRTFKKRRRNNFQSGKKFKANNKFKLMDSTK